jgi:hypothetical protein
MCSPTTRESYDSSRQHQSEQNDFQCLHVFLSCKRSAAPYTLAGGFTRVVISVPTEPE